MIVVSASAAAPPLRMRKPGRHRSSDKRCHLRLLVVPAIVIIILTAAAISARATPTSIIIILMHHLTG